MRIFRRINFEREKKMRKKNLSIVYLVGASFLFRWTVGRCIYNNIQFPVPTWTLLTLVSREKKMFFFSSFIFGCLLRSDYHSFMILINMDYVTHAQARNHFQSNARICHRH